ncbi:MAG: GNAT family N-acetyltransferase [Planctomycetota bacterium]|nr:GNAT family N-acetyltransferase [Planctomycetota bacterium]
MTALRTTPSPIRVDTPRGDERPHAAFRCTCHASLESLAPRRRAWNTFVSSAGSPIYHSYEWCAVWWHHYGGDREARIFIAEEDNRLVGILPMCIDRLRLGPVTLRLARLIGSDSTHVVCDPPLDVDHARAMLEAVMRRLIAEDECDAVLFGPLADDSPRSGAVREFCRRPRKDVRLLRDRVLGPYASIPLPESIEEYERSLSKKQRYRLRHGWSRLRSENGAVARTVCEPDRALAAFDRFARLHAEQWQGRGRLGHFADWPGALEFNRSLVAAMAREGRVRFCRIVAGDTLLSDEYCFLFGRRAHWRLSARRIDPRWDEHGLGRLGLAQMLQTMISEGVGGVEAGPGRYPYKRRLGAVEHDLRSMLLVRDETSSRRRAVVATRLADLLDRVYYRLWYLRLARRFPPARRPLINAWIRSRL